jgi:ethanolamine transporter EutH
MMHSTGESKTLFKTKMIVNLVIYQIAWLACILSAARSIPVLGILAALIAVVWHVSQAQRPLAEFQLILLTGLIGGLWDSLLVILGLIYYPSGSLVPWMAPFWIIALWMAFATTFNLCLRWLHGHYGWAAIFGMVGGPLAWWAGHALGALTLINPLLTLAVLGLGWAALMPVLMRLAVYFDGLSHNTTDFIREN